MISRVSVLFSVYVMLSSLVGQTFGQEPIRISPSITIQNRSNVQVLVNATPSTDPESGRGGVNLRPNASKTFSVLATSRTVLVMASTPSGQWAAKWFPVNQTVYVRFSGNQLILTNVRPR